MELGCFAIPILSFICWETKQNILPPIKQIIKQIKQAYKIKLPDAIVAATAIYLDIPLITFDSDFSKITDLKLALLKL